MLPVISALCAAHALHTAEPWPFERTCWGQSVAQLGDNNNNNSKQTKTHTPRTAPFNVSIIIISITRERKEEDKEMKMSSWSTFSRWYPYFLPPFVGKWY